MNSKQLNNNALESLNKWSESLSRPDLNFRFTALPKPIPNKTYYLSKENVNRFVTITKGKPLFTIAYDADLVLTITLHTFKTSLDGSQWSGSAIEALCDTVYSDLDDIEPPAQGEKVISKSNAVFNTVKAHIAASLLKPKKPLPNAYLAKKGLSNNDWYGHFRSLVVYSNVYRNGLYIPFFNETHELTAYQLIIDKYEVSKTKRLGNKIIEVSGFTASEYTPKAKYVGSDKLFFTEFEGGLKGVYSPIGNEYDPKQGEIFVFEGLATAISFLKIHPAAFGVISGSANNTSPCVQTLLNQAHKGEFEGLKRIIICADNDIVTFQRLQKDGNAQACNAGIYTSVQAYLAHKNNELGVEIAICSIPNNVALEHAATDFDDLRQYLATLGKTLSNWQDYQLSPMQLLKNPLDYCSENKAKRLSGTALSHATHNQNLSAYFNKMGIFSREQTLDVEYLSKGITPYALLNTKGLIFIKSLMGTGKTVLIREYLNKLQQQGKTGLYLCPSRALTKQMRDSLNRNGLKVMHYKDVSNGTNLEGLGCIVGISTINSVWRFDGLAPHTVIIDESEQLLPVITSDIIEFPQSTSDMLTKLCETAHNVIVLDAQMSKLSVDTMQRIKPNVDSLLIHNTFKTAKDKHVSMLSTKGEFWAKFEELLSSQKKIYISTSSKHEARALSEFVKSHYPDIEHLTLVANDDDDVTLLGTLENINNEVLKHQVVIASPVVSSGVSIDVNHFDVVMGYYLPHMPQTPSLVTAIQQLGRVRKVKELYVFYQNRQSASLEIDPNKLLQFKKQELRNMAVPKRVYDDTTETVKVETTYPNHVLLDYENKAKQNLLDRNQKESFLFLLREEGYQVTIESENSALSEYGLILRKEARAVSKAKYHNAIAAAPEIPIEQVAELELTYLKTKEEYAAIEKAKACDFMIIEPKDFTAYHSELWTNGLESKVKRLELQEIPDDVVTDIDSKAYEDAIKKSTELTTFKLQSTQKWLDSVVLSAFFDEEGNHYKEVHNTSPSVIKAKEALLEHSDLLKLKGVNIGQLRIEPLKILNEQMRYMGFDVSSKQVQIDGKRSRFYTASLNPDVSCVLQRRGQSAHGETEKISLMEKDIFPCAPHQPTAPHFLESIVAAGDRQKMLQRWTVMTNNLSVIKKEELKRLSEDVYREAYENEPSEIKRENVARAAATAYLLNWEKLQITQTV